MNKLTKVLSVFLIAGAIGAGVAGAAGCAHKHSFDTDNWASKEGATTHWHASKCGHDVTSGEEPHEGNPGENCGKCGYKIPEEGKKPGEGDGDKKPGDDDGKEYDEVTTDINFDEVAKEIKPGASGNLAISEPYTYKGKVTFNTGGSARFEVGSNCFNTQGASGTIVIKLSGVTNSLSVGGKGASDKFTGYSLKNESGTAVKEETLAGQVDFSFDLTDLPAGTYTLTTNGGAARIKKLTLVEKLEKSAASGISVSTNNVDFLKGDELVTSGLSVTLNYSNGRKDALSANEYEIDKSAYKKDEAGKYTITVSYKENPEFKATYDVYVYTIDEIEVHTIGYNSSGKAQLTVQQAVITGGTLNSNNLTVKGTGTVGEGDSARTHVFNLPAAALNIELPSTASVGEKTVSISVKDTYTTGGKSLTGSYTVVVKDKITATNDKVEVQVGKTRDLKTLTQAVQYLKACGLKATDEKVIRLDEDEYKEKVWIDMDNVTLIGSGTNADKSNAPDKTRITCSLVEGDPDPMNGSLWGLDCATVHVAGKNFKAYNIAIRNDFDYINNASKYSGSQSSQGLALTIDGDGAVLSECHLYGNQDTLFMKSGRCYFYKSQIDGNVDFIFGNETGLAYFEECTIKAISRTATGAAQNGYVTAAKHTADKKPDYGYIFANCTFTADNIVKEGSMSLGRPWGAKATVAYISCTFSKHYSKLPSDDKGNDHRWSEMSGAKPEDADFKEYDSKGDGAISTEVKGGKIIDKATADLHTKANIFGVDNGKKVGYTTTWDCDGELTKLHATAKGQKLAEYTVTIKNVDGMVDLGQKTYTEGQTLIVAQLIAFINDIDAVKNADKEVDKIYSSYVAADNCSELTADYQITASSIVYVSLKAKDHTVSVDDIYGFDTSKAASDLNYVEKVEQDDIVEYGKLKIYGGTSGDSNNYFEPNNNPGWFRMRGDAYIEFTVSTPVRMIITTYGGGLVVTKVGGSVIADADGTASMKFDITEEGTYRITSPNGQQYLNEVRFDAVPTKDVTVTLYNTDGESPTKVGESWEMYSGDYVNASKLQTLLDTVTAPSGKEFAGYFKDEACQNAFDPAKDKLSAGAQNLYIGWKNAATTLNTITEATGFNFGKQSGIAGEKVAGSTDTVAAGATKIILDYVEVSAKGTEFKTNGGGWYSVGAETKIKIKVGAGLTVKFRVYTLSKFTVTGVSTGYISSDNSQSGYDYWIVAAQENEAEITLECSAADYIGCIIVEAAS